MTSLVFCSLSLSASHGRDVRSSTESDHHRRHVCRQNLSHSPLHARCVQRELSKHHRCVKRGGGAEEAGKNENTRLRRGGAVSAYIIYTLYRLSPCVVYRGRVLWRTADRQVTTSWFTSKAIMQGFLAIVINIAERLRSVLGYLCNNVSFASLSVPHWPEFLFLISTPAVPEIFC